MTRTWTIGPLLSSDSLLLFVYHFLLLNNIIEIICRNSIILDGWIVIYVVHSWTLRSKDEVSSAVKGILAVCCVPGSWCFLKLHPFWQVLEGNEYSGLFSFNWVYFSDINGCYKFPFFGVGLNSIGANWINFLFIRNLWLDFLIAIDCRR